jgi:hypothetical protein
MPVTQALPSRCQLELEVQPENHLQLEVAVAQAGRARRGHHDHDHGCQCASGTPAAGTAPPAGSSSSLSAIFKIMMPVVTTVVSNCVTIAVEAAGYIGADTESVSG